MFQRVELGEAKVEKKTDPVSAGELDDFVGRS
jgi:hypothetical protein